MLATELTGDLPCVGCGYNLRGLSIRAMCPECRLPVRATLLAIVDPKAEELAPLTRPGLTAWGMVLWSAAALVGALAAWSIRLEELTFSAARISWAPSWAPWVVIAAAVLSGAGAAVFIRPHAKVPAGLRLRAAVGVLAHIPIAILLWVLYAKIDAGVSLPVLGQDGMTAERVGARLALGAMLVVAILGVQPNARALAMRSIVIRTGRVDRQSLLALVAPLAIAAVGDVLHLIDFGVRGPIGRALHWTEVSLVAAGSVLFTIGLFGILIDCLRLRPIIRIPGIGITDVLDDERGGAR